MCKKHPCITTVREHLTRQKPLKKYGGFSPHANDTFTINLSPSLAYYADWYYTYVLTSVLGEREELKLWSRALRRAGLLNLHRRGVCVEHKVYKTMITVGMNFKQLMMDICTIGMLCNVTTNKYTLKSLCFTQLFMFTDKKHSFKNYGVVYKYYYTMY